MISVKEIMELKNRN